MMQCQILIGFAHHYCESQTSFVASSDVWKLGIFALLEILLVSCAQSLIIPKRYIPVHRKKIYIAVQHLQYVHAVHRRNKEKQYI